jgi:molecular chaperone GrpE
MTEPHPSPLRDGPRSADGEPAEPADASTDGRTDGRTDDSADQAAAEKAELERRVAELDDLWRRAVAEQDNLRKRAARDLSRVRDQERAQVAAGWLPVVDNLELALDNARASPDSIIEGVRAVHQQALDVLTRTRLPPSRRRRQDVRPGAPRSGQHGAGRGPAARERSPMWSARDMAPMTRCFGLRPSSWPPGVRDGQGLL